MQNKAGTRDAARKPRWQLHDYRPEHAGVLLGVAVQSEVVAGGVEEQAVQPQIRGLVWAAQLPPGPSTVRRREREA